VLVKLATVPVSNDFFCAKPSHSQKTQQHSTYISSKSPRCAMTSRSPQIQQECLLHQVCSTRRYTLFYDCFTQMAPATGIADYCSHYAAKQLSNSALRKCYTETAPFNHVAEGRPPTFCSPTLSDCPECPQTHLLIKCHRSMTQCTTRS